MELEQKQLRGKIRKLDLWSLGVFMNYELSYTAIMEQ